MTVIKRQQAPEHEALTESLAQDLVYSWCYQAGHEITVPNCGTAWGYESDVASMTRARLGHEFEIKVSRADWLAELRQVRGGTRCAKRSRAEALNRARDIARELQAAHKRGRPHAVIGGRWYGFPPPNYFWMVTAAGIIREGELPAWAGLMEIQDTARGYTLQTLRPAPRLHPMKMLDSQVMAMARGACLRYWQARKRKRG